MVACCLEQHTTLCGEHMEERSALPNNELETLRKQFRELKQRLQEVSEKAKEARRQRDVLNGEVKRLSAEIRSLREELLAIRDELSKVREEKNKYYEQMQELKERRAEIIEALREHRAKIKKLREEIRLLRNLLGPRRYDADELKARIEQLEWQYQTTTLPPEAEKAILKKIRSLESIYINVKRMNEIRAEIDSSRNQIIQLRNEIEGINEKLKGIVDNYLALKEKYQELRKQRDELIEKIQALREEREKKREEANKYHEQFLELVKEERTLREELERVSVLLKAKELSRVIEKKKKVMYAKALEAYEKYKRGEPLSLDEFKLLVEFNMLQSQPASAASEPGQ